MAQLAFIQGGFAGALISLVALFGIPYMQSENPKETAGLLINVEALARRLSELPEAA